MMSYTQEILEKIHKVLEEGNDSLALATIEEELSMPYVPLEFEKQLNDLRKEILGRRQEDVKRNVFSDEQIVAMLSMDDVSALSAMHQLSSRNIRSFIKQLSKLFADPMYSHWRKSLLIELLVSQQVSETMTLVDANQMRYEFIPMYVELPIESDGYQLANQWLVKWLENDNPSLLHLSQQLLLQDCAMKLPLSYSEDEGMYLAASVLKTVLLAFSDVKQWQSFVKEHKIEEHHCWEIDSIPEFSTH